MKYVIIGNSAAAIGAVEGIRQIDAASPIVLISKEPHHTYSRPLISYLLWGKTDERRMKYRPDDFYEVNHVQALLGRAAASIDAKRARSSWRTASASLTISCCWRPAPRPSCRRWPDWKRSNAATLF